VLNLRAAIDSPTLKNEEKKIVQNAHTWPSNYMVSHPRTQYYVKRTSNLTFQIVHISF